MAKKVTLKDYDDTILYPQTVADAVYDEDGNPLLAYRDIGFVCYNINSNSVMDADYNIQENANIIVINTSGESSAFPLAFFECYNAGGQLDAGYNLSESSEPIVPVEPEIPEYDATRFFTDIATVDTSETDSFCGFPGIVTYHGVIYAFYRWGVPHSTVYGVEQDKIYYKFSGDGGKTWSARKYLEFPASETTGKYRDYRSLHPFAYDDNLYSLGVIAPSTTSALKTYRSFFCKLTVDETTNELSYTDFGILPYMDGETVSSPVSPESDNDVTTNCIAGKPLVLGDTVYFCVYYGESARSRAASLCSLSVTGQAPSVSDVSLLHTFSAESKKYSETGLFNARQNIGVVLRDENGTNDVFIYDITSGTASFVNSTEFKYYGPECLSINDNLSVLAGRDYSMLSYPQYEQYEDALCLLTGGGIPIKELIRFVGHPTVMDSMYCSFAVAGAYVCIVYYYRVPGSTQIYKVESKRIYEKDFNYLLNI